MLKSKGAGNASYTHVSLIKIVHCGFPAQNTKGPSPRQIYEASAIQAALWSQSAASKVPLGSRNQRYCHWQQTWFPTNSPRRDCPYCNNGFFNDEIIDFYLMLLMVTNRGNYKLKQGTLTIDNPYSHLTLNGTRGTYYQRLDHRWKCHCRSQKQWNTNQLHGHASRQWARSLG